MIITWQKRVLQKTFSIATTCILFLNFTFSGIVLRAQDNNHYLGVRLYTENDFLTPISINQDDNYTGGVKFEMVTNLLSPLVDNKVLNPLHWDPVMQMFSFVVTAYTPNHIGESRILYDERPFASYRSWNIGAAFKKDNKRLSYEWYFGSIGRPLAGEAQSTIHRKGIMGTTRPIPLGWPNQIANGGTFAIHLRANYEQRISDGLRKDKALNWMVLSWLHEVNAGQFQLSYKQGLRVNLFTYHTDLPGEEDIPSLEPLLGNRTTTFGVYAYITPYLKGVAHNATLTGRWLAKSSVHTIPQGELSKALIEYDAGVQLRLCALRVGYSLFGRSREYNKEEKAFHHWGGIYLGIVAHF